MAVRPGGEERTRPDVPAEDEREEALAATSPTDTLAPPVREARRMRGSRLSWENRDLLAAAAFTGPNIVLYLVFVMIPAVVGVLLAFFEWDLFGSPEFVGLDHYLRIADDRRVPRAIFNTGLFALFGVVPTVLLGFMIATLINLETRWVRFLRTFYFMPFVVSVAVSAVLWSWLFNPQVGIFNTVLAFVGIDGPAWLTNTTWALPALTLMIIWLSLPLVVILYLAGLQDIPQNMIEAAMIDGAGPWTRLWRIIWPSVAPTTLLVFILEMLHFIVAPFEVALIMTDGGPLDATMSIFLYTYEVAFVQQRVGYASALAVFQFVLVLLVLAVLRSIQRYRGASGAFSGVGA